MRSSAGMRSGAGMRSSGPGPGGMAMMGRLGTLPTSLPTRGSTVHGLEVSQLASIHLVSEGQKSREGGMCLANEDHE